MESRRCLISDASTWSTSASSSSRPFSTPLFMIAAFIIRSAERRAASLAFIAAVMSALTLSLSAMCASVILIGVAVGDVPAVGLVVKALRHLHRVDLDAHIDARLDVEVAVAAQDAAKGAVHRVAAHFVGILDPGGTVDPSQQRLQPGNIVGIDQEIDQHRHPAKRLMTVAVDGVAMELALALQ